MPVASGIGYARGHRRHPSQDSPHTWQGTLNGYTILSSAYRLAAGWILFTCRPLVAFGLLFAGFPGVSVAQMIVVPNSTANIEGNAENVFPFDITDAGSPSQRYQQVFAASQFGGIVGPTWIGQISFRADGTFGAGFSSTLSSVRIDLSTTARVPDGLSMTFANNVGGDNMTVFGGATGAPLSLSATASGGPPHAFDITVNLATPFLYNPAAGNLLLDVRNFAAGMTTYFDVQDSIGDSVSRVVNFGSVNSATADISDSIGLVTQFTFIPVPEPSAILLAGAGASVFSGWRLRRRFRSEHKLVAAGHGVVTATRRRFAGSKLTIKHTAHKAAVKMHIANCDTSPA